jgi:hypothetical protein
LDELVAVEVFGADVGRFYACVFEHLVHGGDHLRRAADVVDGDIEIVDECFQQGFVDRAGLAFPGLGGFFWLGHGGDEVEVRVFLLGLGEIVEEDRVFGAAIGVEEDEFLVEFGARRFENYATDGCDADASGEEDGGDAVLLVEGEFSPGRLEREFGAEGDGFEGALEGGVAHAGGDHEVVFVGGASEGEAALVALLVGLGRVGEGEVSGLPCNESEACGFFEVERHGSGGYFFAAFKFDLVVRQWISSLAGQLVLCAVVFMMHCGHSGSSGVRLVVDDGEKSEGVMGYGRCDCGG